MSKDGVRSQSGSSSSSVRYKIPLMSVGARCRVITREKEKMKESVVASIEKK